MTDIVLNCEEINAAIAAESLLAGLSDDHQNAMVKLVSRLSELQQSLNLTAIKDPLAMVRYHVADSLALLAVMAQEDTAGGITAIDIGTGGGFPLLPMAIVRPGIHWIGVESIQKKVVAVRQMADELGLQNVELRAERAEDVGRGGLRESVDVVTARAVGPVASLLEVGIPLLKQGGKIHLFKTESVRDEWDRCGALLGQLGAQVAGEYQYRLEGDSQTRILFSAVKIAPTPEKFPRRAGVPFNKPLVS